MLDRAHIIVDVTMKATVPLFRVGEACEKHGSITYFPQFSATGTVKEGATVIEVSGGGYGNRVTQNFMLTETSKFHTALRWQKDGIGFDVHDYQTPPELGDEWLPILMVHKDGRMIHVSQNYKKENL